MRAAVLLQVLLLALLFQPAPSLGQELVPETWLTVLVLDADGASLADAYVMIAGQPAGEASKAEDGRWRTATQQLPGGLVQPLVPGDWLTLVAYAPHHKLKTVRWQVREPAQSNVVEVRMEPLSIDLQRLMQLDLPAPCQPGARATPPLVADLPEVQVTGAPIATFRERDDTITFRQGGGVTVTHDGTSALSADCQQAHDRLAAELLLQGGWAGE